MTSPFRLLALPGRRTSGCSHHCARQGAGFFRRAVALPLLLLALPALAAISNDDRLLAARDASRAGDRVKFERFAATLGSREVGDLDVYLEYWGLMVDLERADPLAVKAFLTAHEGSYLAEKLRGDWLRGLGKNGQWGLFDTEFPALARPDQELSCYALQSRRSRGDASALDEAMPLWLDLIEPPESCVSLLEALIVEKRVQSEDVWARIRRQFEAGKTAAARNSMNYLSVSQTPDARTITAVIEKPLPWLYKLPNDIRENRMLRELAALAVSRIARSDPRMAALQMQKLDKQLESNEQDWAWSQIGRQAADSHLPEALEYYAHAGESPMSDAAAEWRVRAALRAQDWTTVRVTIESMPPDLAAQPAWIYWLGRADSAMGRKDEAGALFARIAGQPNFYGNLADEELGRQIMTPSKALPPTKDEMAQAAATPGLRRALALYRLDLRSEGFREWNWTLTGMSDRQLLAASELALRHHVFDRAIASADRTRDEHDYSLRYLAPFANEVRAAARDQALDEAWVYGLMRQESRFITSAKSTVGAAGLMQLMPATAKWVARKIGLKDFHHGQVHDTETNLLLGTSYMRIVMESLDNHPVLASAAYNAGPGRARRWRGDRTLEGAIYAESIPFNETRDYVKKVMSNAVYYAALFDGKPQSLKQRLGVVEAPAPADPNAEELP